MADDIEIDFEKMSLWTADEATAYLESGGEDEPGKAPAGPAAAAQLPKPTAEEFKPGSALRYVGCVLNAPQNGKMP